MGIRIERISKSTFIFFSIIAMLCGLFVSRVLLSTGMISFLLLTCFHKNFPTQVSRFFSNPVLIGTSLLFLVPFLSGLWSQDKQEWVDYVRIKLPLLLLPLAFAGDWNLSPRQWSRIGSFFILLLFIGCCWSLWQYGLNMHAIHESYLRAQVIPTPFENDHVRFSLAVCIAIIYCVMQIERTGKKRINILVGFLISFFILYLHILSARTGLLSFYIFLVLYIFHLARSVKLKWIILAGAIIILLPVAAWFLLPTFHNRIRYNLYDFSFASKQAYLPGSSDGNRVLSINAGWDILKRNTLGVGSGDVIQETYKWYGLHVPQMLESDKLYPSSEWLIYGAAAGWLGVLVFTGVMLAPLFIKTKTNHFFWISLNSILALSFLFDIGLEVQFGVFLYAFVVLWWWKWLSPENNRDAIR